HEIMSRRFLSAIALSLLVLVLVLALEAPARARRQPASLQAVAEEILASSRVPYGAIAVVRVPDAKVLALAGHSEVEPALGADELVLSPWAPAASVFKLITAAALLDGRGVPPDEKVCFHGGSHALERIHLIDVPRLDRECETLSFAIAHSQ